VIKIFWKVQPQVPATAVADTKKQVQTWANANSDNWENNQKINHRMPIETKGGEIVVQLKMSVVKEQGGFPQANVSSCKQVTSLGEHADSPLVDPTMSYLLQPQVDGGQYKTMILSAVADGFGLRGTLAPWAMDPDDAGGNPQVQLLFVPLDNGLYAITIVDCDIVDDNGAGYALTDGVSSVDTGGAITQFLPYTGGLSQAWSLVDNGDGTLSIKSAGTDSLLAVYDEANCDVGGMSVGSGSLYMVKSDGSQQFGDRRVASAFMLTALTRCGTYPAAVGPVQTPVPLPPTPTSVDQQMPTRVPDDSSNDPVFGEVVLPYFMVLGDLAVDRQVNVNPYYLLRHSRYYDRTSIYQRQTGPQYTATLDITTGMTQTDSQSITDTTTMQVMADGGFSFGPLSADVSASIENSLVVERTSTTEVMTTVQSSVSQTLNDGEGALFANYVLVHAFELFRADGTSVRRWVMSNQNDVYAAEYITPQPHSEKVEL